MSILNAEVVDFISIDLMGNAVLTIADHLPWDNGNEHLLALQNKINAYLAFIEGGDIYQKYPDAKDRKIVIKVTAKYEPNGIAKTFLETARQILQSAGYGFQFEVLKMGEC
jgi:hypothetical protein